jgi:hypothetical protein
MRLWFRLSLITIAVLICVDPASALPRGFCGQYATRAAAAVKKFNDAGCRTTDRGRWNPDHNVHLNWCLAQGEDSQDWANNETSFRESTANDCAACQSYTNRAVAARQKAEAAGCVHTDGRWTATPQQHRAFCNANLNENREWVDNETAIREDRAEQCSICRDYAGLAEKALKANQNDGCGLSSSFRDDDWNPDPQAHFNACQGFPPDDNKSRAARSTEFMTGRTNSMFGGLAYCRANKRLPPQETFKEGVSFCQAYADRAVAAARRASAAGCAIAPGGPRWTATHEQHRRWCSSEADRSRDSVNGETAVRDDRAEQCAWCRQYAKIASEAARHNNNFRCGFTGAGWSPDEQAQFNWCQSLDVIGPGQRAADSQTVAGGVLDQLEGAIARCVQQARKTGKTQQGLASAPVDPVTVSTNVILNFGGEWDGRNIIVLSKLPPGSSGASPITNITTTPTSLKGKPGPGPGSSGVTLVKGPPTVTSVRSGCSAMDRLTGDGCGGVAGGAAATAGSSGSNPARGSGAARTSSGAGGGAAAGSSGSSGVSLSRNPTMGGSSGVSTVQPGGIPGQRPGMGGSSGVSTVQPGGIPGTRSGGSSGVSTVRP